MLEDICRLSLVRRLEDGSTGRLALPDDDDGTGTDDVQQHGRFSRASCSWRPRFPADVQHPGRRPNKRLGGDERVVEI